MKYGAKLWDKPTTWNFMLDNSSDLKSENGEGSGSGGLHIINQVTLNDENIVCLGNHMKI